MDDASKILPAELSRRSILRNFSLTAGGAAMLSTIIAGGVATLGTILSGTREAAAQTKMTPVSVGYQGTPKGAQRCDNCTQFESPASCKVVQGNIAAAGWCKIYAKKPA
jgi:predicted NBD/HSP70 family sugar kinase